MKTISVATVRDARTLAPTTALRWRDVRKPIMDGEDAVGVKIERVLEQGWVCQETGETKWREIPVV